MIRLALAVLLALVVYEADAQTWTRIFGGSKNETANQIIRTSDGGYLIAGNTDSYNEKVNVYLVKTDVHGVLQWQKTIFSNYYESAVGVVQTDNGSVFVVSNSTDSLNYKKIKLIKLDLQGNILFSQDLSGTSSEVASGIVSVANDIVISGTVTLAQTGDDIFTLKLDSAGGQIWRKEINMGNTQQSNGFRKTSNGNFLVAGLTKIGSIYYSYALNLTNAGDTIWTRSGLYGNTIEGFESCTSLAGDSVFIFVPGISSTTNAKRFQFAAYSASGNFLRYFNSQNSIPSFMGQIFDLAPDSLGGFTVAGAYDEAAQYPALAYFDSWLSEIKWKRSQMKHKSINPKVNSKYTSFIKVADKFILTGNSRMFGFFENTKSNCIFIQTVIEDGGMDAMADVSITNDTSNFCFGSGSQLSVTSSFDKYQWMTYNSNKYKYSWFPGANNFTQLVDTGGEYYCTMWNDDYYAFASRPYDDKVTCYGIPDTQIRNTGKLIHCILMGTIKLYVTNAENATYKWFFNGVAIPSSNKNEYVPLVTGLYSIQVTNPCYSLISAGTFVDVTNGPLVEVFRDTIYAKFDSRSGNICTETLSAGWSGMSYAWYRDGQALGWTSSYIYPNAPGIYWVDRTSPCGINRGVFTVIFDTVISTITTHGVLTGCNTVNTWLSVRANGSDYQWYRNGFPVGTFGDTTLWLGSFGTGSYYCKVYQGGCMPLISDTVFYQYSHNGSFDINYGSSAVSCGLPKILTALFTSANSYEWYLNGVAIPNSNSINFTATQTGSYHYVCSTTCGIAISWAIYIQFGPPSGFTSTVQPNRPIIYSATDTLSVQLVFQYPQVFNTSVQWKRNGQNVSLNSGSNISIGGLYECYMTNACGTSLASSIYIGTHLENNVLMVTGDTNLCSGDSVILELPNSLTGVYKWYKGFIPISGATSNNLTVKDPGTYFGSYYSLYGIMYTKKVEVKVNPRIIADIYHTSPLSICSSSAVELNASQRNDYTYKWYRDGFTILGASNYNYLASLTGAYSVEVTDSNNCVSLLGNAMIRDSILSHISLSLNGPNMICQGESKTITAPTGFVSYQWFIDKIALPGATGSSLVVNAPGHYSVEVINSTDCKGIGRLYIRQFAPIGSIYTMLIPESCNNSKGNFIRKFDVPVDIVVTGPNGYSYVGDQTKFATGYNLSAGKYIFNYSYPNTSFCIQTDTLDLPSEVYKPVITYTPYSNPNVCNNEPVVLSLTASSSGYYLWSTGATTSSILITNPGLYSIIQYNFDSTCVGTDTFIASINQAPVLNLSIIGNPNFCSGNAVTLDAGIGHSSYSWNTGDTTQVITATVGGRYVVTVHDTGSPCTATDTAFVHVLNTLALNISNFDTLSICQGNSVVPIQFPSNSTYLWSNGQTTLSMTPTNSGWYSLFATDPNGCNAEDSVYINIIIPAIPNIFSSGPTSFCQGQSTILNAGVMGSQYLWSTGETTQHISVSSTGLYWVNIINGGGACIYSDSIQILVNPDPVVSISPGTSIDACQGQSVNLSITSNPGYTYLWSTGETTSNISLSASSNVSVTVTDILSGCSASEFAVVTFHAPPLISITANGPTTFCAGDSVTITAVSSGNNFMWMRNNLPILGSNTSVFVAKNKGSYKCLTTDNFGCIAISSSVYVSVPCQSLGSDVSKEESDDLFFIEKLFSIYPNPAFDKIYIQTSMQNYSLKIYALDGKLVKQLDIHKDEEAIDISKLSDGIYFIVAMDNKGRLHSSKFVKAAD